MILTILRLISLVASALKLYVPTSRWKTQPFANNLPSIAATPAPETSVVRSDVLVAPISTLPELERNSPHREARYRCPMASQAFRLALDPAIGQEPAGPSRKKP
jgi:hypothetical protein